VTNYGIAIAATASMIAITMINATSEKPLRVPKPNLLIWLSPPNTVLASPAGLPGSG